jgi:hypothetical protein
VLSTRNHDGDEVVLVLPITHRQPSDPELAVEIPAATKRRLGLDGDRSWIVMTDSNRFIWPGPDLRLAVPGDVASVVYGYLPRALLLEVRQKLVRALEKRLAGVVRRTSEARQASIPPGGSRLVRLRPWLY